MCVVCFLFAHVLWAQESVLNQRMRGSLQNQTPGSLYMQNVEVPSLLQGQTGVEETGKQPEEQLPYTPMEIRFDKKVDPNQYIVGPGDWIGLYLWGDLDREYRNMVSPEGFLILPTVGEVMVSDLTLTQAYEKVKEKVNKHYKGIELSIYLLRPRQFRLYISGLVINPGMIDANSLERVSDVIDRAGLQYVERASMIEEIQNISLGRSEQARSYSQEQTTRLMQTRALESTYGVIANDAQVVKKGSSQRSIEIFRGGNGTGDKVLEVDLLRFRKAGDVNANPYVAMGDRIHVPEYGGDIIITGEVNDPNRYEFKPGDRITNLVVFGGGLTVLSDTTEATLVRFKVDGLNTDNIPINLYDALLNNPDDPKYLLKESDRLYVRRKFNYKNLTNVIVDGQVKFPGEYAIVPGKTQLSDIIAQAGGFTDDANLPEARIQRRYSSATSDLEFDRLRKMQRYEMTDEEYDYYKSRSRMPSGKLTIDFVKLFNDHDKTLDIVLQHGDNIFIPIKREFVQVSGAVDEPGYVRFKSGEGVPYYVNLAGGYKFDANAKKVRVIKANSGQRLKPGKSVIIEGGDIIHVPEKTPFDQWQAVKDSALLFANVSTVIILARQLTK